MGICGIMVTGIRVPGGAVTPPAWHHGIGATEMQNHHTPRSPRSSTYKTCKFCGETYKSRNVTYCSTSCRDRDKDRRKPKACIRCGKVFQPSSHLRKYCSLECHNLSARGRRKKPVPLPKPCAVCGETVPLLEDDTPASYRRRQTCSDGCAYELTSIRQRGYVPADPEKRCAACGKNFGPRSGEQANRYAARRTCSYECMIQARAAARRARYSKSKTCPICGQVFTRHDNETPSSFETRRACGQECGIALSLRTRSESTIQWSPYPPVFNKALKERIRARDNHRCQLCGSKGGRRKLAVHHINYNKQDCTPGNLIALCQSCHSKTNFDREFWFITLSRRVKQTELPPCS